MIVKEYFNSDGESLVISVSRKILRISLCLDYTDGNIFMIMLRLPLTNYEYEPSKSQRP